MLLYFPKKKFFTKLCIAVKTKIVTLITYVLEHNGFRTTLEYAKADAEVKREHRNQ